MYFRLLDKIYLLGDILVGAWYCKSTSPKREGGLGEGGEGHMEWGGVVGKPIDSQRYGSWRLGGTPN